VLLLWRQRRRRALAEGAWRSDASNASKDAIVAHDLLDNASHGPVDPARLRAVRDQVETATTRLAHVAAAAPDNDARERTCAVEQALRDYMFAVEAEQLLRDHSTPPSADQLGAADSTRREHARQLENAMAELSQRVSPASG